MIVVIVDDVVVIDDVTVIDDVVVIDDDDDDEGYSCIDDQSILTMIISYSIRIYMYCLFHALRHHL